MDYSQKDIERFWSKVDKERSTTFYNGSRCWEWVAGCFSNGYGNVWIGGTANNLTHRISYNMAYGNIPAGMFVLHHCDNPSCVNPGHLFLGTHKDNMDDKVQKGRASRFGLRGEENKQHKLTNEQVAEIRKLYTWRGKHGQSTTSLAKLFGVSRQSIWEIVKNKAWT